MLKSSPTTTLVNKIVLSDGSTLSYEYDAEERITGVVDKHSVNGEVIETKYEYTYDALGQLLTETVNGVAVNTMTYDNYGNILTKNGKTYTYGDSKWKDLLTEYDGQSITYDDGGNPINYLGHTLTWEKGRQLKSFDDITYTYNANGIRTSKTVNGVKHEYTLDGTNIVKETWDGNTLVPLYDNTESVCGITYNGASYYFLKNLQGDVIAITDSTGSVVARYSYDAWGVCTIESDTTDCIIAEINPYSYRSYYLDREIGMYYLQSRYYDPNVGRFITVDSVALNCAEWLSVTLYCYCENAPIHRLDAYGFVWWKVAIVVGAAVVAIVHIVNASVALNQAEYNKKHDTKEIVSNQNNIDMKLGGKSFAAMGCGAAATHNAIILAGGSSSLANVVKFMQAHDLTLGFAGVYFTNIQLYLKKQGYPNKIYLTSLKNKIDKKIKDSDRKIAILAYKHSSGGHYVAIKYNSSKKKFYVYNSDRKLSSIDKWIEDNKYAPLCLITLKK